jgi:hypothetical protein
MDGFLSRFGWKAKETTQKSQTPQSKDYAPAIRMRDKNQK